MGRKKFSKKRKIASSEVSEEVKRQRKERPARPATIVPSVMNDTFEIVPWSSREEWEEMRQNFHDGLYEKVIEDLCVWRERVPTLPVGAEVTLLIAQAFAYDKKYDCCEDRSRSLYSLALIRYLNHVGHYSAYALGEQSTLPTRDLASLAGTPDWLASLRNEVSHGTNTPSLESLRVAGLFICEWLKERYWKESDSVDPETAGSESFDEEVTSAISAFMATRIYALRGMTSIDDPCITKWCSVNPSAKISTKTATSELLQIIKTFIVNHNQYVIPLVTRELIPTQEFFKEFCQLVSRASSPMEQEKEGFEQLASIWSPLTTVLQRKGKLLEVCECLLDIHIECVNEPFIRWTVATWIEKLLELHEEKYGTVFSSRLYSLLKKSMLSPDSSSKLFLPRLLKLVEHKLGEATVSKLQSLASLWTDSYSTKNSTKKAFTSGAKSTLKSGSYFTLEQFQSSETCSEEAEHQLTRTPLPAKWTEDIRGSEFWKQVSLGETLHTPASNTQ